MMSKHQAYGYRGRISPILIAILAVLYGDDVNARQDENAIAPYASQDVQFDPAFLNMEDAANMDLSRFSRGAAATPGVYTVAVYVNGAPLTDAEIEFRQNSDKSVTPCLTAALVRQLPLDFSRLPANLLENDQVCIDLMQAIPAATIYFDSNEQQLDIQIPQMYVSRQARGSVSPALWDSGIAAAMLGYSLNAYASESHGREYKSFYGNINAGLNLGAWYLRHNGNYNWEKDGEHSYNTLNTYLQRDIPAIRGRLLVGQSNTTGIVFDTLPFSGVQLASDERMLPESQRGYAPAIRGVARTNAKVTIHQNGQAIYETTVQPGEFLIDDLYPTGYGGDLSVTIDEADGSQQTFTVPYASVTELLRPGMSKYAFTAGQLRNDSVKDNPALYQATYQRGLTNYVTGYGGVQASQDYYATQLGAAFGGNEVGAVAVDVTQARTHLDQRGNSRSGQSYKISYSKLIQATQSNLGLAAYRFSTSGYMDYLTAMQTRDAIQRGYDRNSIWRSKNRFTASASQSLPDGWGQFYLNASLQTYWNYQGTDKQYQFGYSNMFRDMVYRISVGRTYSGVGEKQDTITLSFTVPLGRKADGLRPSLRGQLDRDSTGRYSEQVAISGTAGNENQFSYGVSAMNANKGVGTSGSVNGQYRSDYTSLSSSYSVGKHYQSASLGMMGSMVAHSGGVTFTPYVSDTLALVEAKGAQGASVSSYPGVRIDRWGYALVPYLSPYRLNSVSLDPKDTGTDVELEYTDQKVAPYSGAVVKLKYGTKRGTPVLIMATWQDAPLPFGAEVLDAKGRSIGAVGQGGQIYARVEKDQGQLTVRWGNNAASQCKVSYRLMPTKPGRVNNTTQRFNTVCE